MIYYMKYGNAPWVWHLVYDSSTGEFTGRTLNPLTDHDWFTIDVRYRYWITLPWHIMTLQEWFLECL